MNPTPPAAVAVITAALDDYRLTTPPEQQTPDGAARRIAEYLRGSGYAITPQPSTGEPAPRPCPTPTKHRYATREAAQLVAARTQIPFGQHLNTYPCKCGWFHNTKLADPSRYTDPAA